MGRLWVWADFGPTLGRLFRIWILYLLVTSIRYFFRYFEEGLSDSGRIFSAILMMTRRLLQVAKGLSSGEVKMLGTYFPPARDIPPAHKVNESRNGA